MDIHEMGDRIEDEKKKRAKPGSKADIRGIKENAKTALGKLAGGPAKVQIEISGRGDTFEGLEDNIVPTFDGGRRYNDAVARLSEKYGIPRDEAARTIREHIDIARDIFRNAGK